MLSADTLSEKRKKGRRLAPAMFLLIETGSMNLKRKAGKGRRKKKGESKKKKKRMEEIRRSVGNGDYSPWQGKDL